MAKKKKKKETQNIDKTCSILGIRQEADYKSEQWAKACVAFGPNQDWSE